MSKTGRINHRRGTGGRPKAQRHITVRGVRRDPPDLRKLSRAVIAIALREAELAAGTDDTTETEAPEKEPPVSPAEEVAHD